MVLANLKRARQEVCPLGSKESKRDRDNPRLQKWDQGSEAALKGERALKGQCQKLLPDLRVEGLVTF